MLMTGIYLYIWAILSDFFNITTCYNSGVCGRERANITMCCVCNACTWPETNKQIKTVSRYRNA